MASEFGSYSLWALRCSHCVHGVAGMTKATPGLISTTQPVTEVTVRTPRGPWQGGEPRMLTLPLKRRYLVHLGFFVH